MGRKSFLKIGEFARVCHTTKDTLLHYDRKGLLRPAYVSENGYRRYSMRQFFDFDLISLLKETGSTLEEIRKCRESCGDEGYLGLVTERIAVLEREQERMEHRLSMLRGLADLGEKARCATYDRLFFERREALEIRVYPVDSDKIAVRESSAECYSECLMRSLMEGNSIDPPLGVIIPEDCACRGEFRIASMFTAAWRDVGRERAGRMESGRYACLFHRGDMQSHEEAFIRMTAELSARGERACGPVYAFDQMNYVLGDTGEEYIAEYLVMVNDDRVAEKIENTINRNYSDHIEECSSCCYSL